MKNGRRRLLVGVLLMALTVQVGLSAGGIGAAPSAALDGSFTAALALRRTVPGDTGGEAADVLLLTPAADTVTAATLVTGAAAAHIVGWRDADNLLVARSSGAGYEVVRFDGAGGGEQVLATGLSADRGYRLTPDSASVMSWPRHATPFQDLWVYDAVGITLRSTFDVGGAVSGAELVGWNDSRAYFITGSPADALVMVDLAGGTVSGPIDLLAAGDGDELIVDASLSAASGLALVGRTDPKDLNGVYSVPLQMPDFWPITSEGSPRPTAQAQPHTLSAIGEAQRIIWSTDGTQAVIVAAPSGEFGFSNAYLSGPGFVSATVTGARLAFDSCVLFTPDDQWLLYVSAAGDTLLALSLADSTALPQTLYSGVATLDLCEAAWQPDGTTGGGVTIGGGVTLDQPTAIAVGETVTGRVDDDRYAVEYELTLQAGETVTITMVRTSNELDPLLFLFGPAGVELARNDDAAVAVGGSFVNSQIADFTAPADGVYTIRATRFREQAGPTVGNFELSVVAGGGAGPEAGQTIAVGDSVTGAITEDVAGVDYAITLTAGQAITVTMEATNGLLDPYLSISGADGRELAYNDDAVQAVGDSSFNSQIVNFVAPADGTYTIRATRYRQESGTSTGEFRLTVETSQPVTGGDTIPVLPITIGGSTTGEITNSQYAADYTISLQTGQRITVSMERQGGTLDAYLVILNAQGQEIAFNDDATPQVGITPLNAQIEGFAAPAPGIYTIRATRLGQQAGSSVGQYLLRVADTESVVPVPTATPVVSGGPVRDGVQVGGEIAVGGTYTGSIGGEVYTVEYSIELTAGETIALSVMRTSGDLDAFLIIYNTNNDADAYNDDAATMFGDTPYNAAITGYTAPVSGTYYVWVTRFQLEDGSSAGNFVLQVTTGVPVTVQAGGSISVGDTVTGEITDTNFAVDYTLQLDAGQTITATMERLSDTLDTYLAILDSDGVELMFNDDADTQVGDSALNSQIVFTAPFSGTYTIRATRFFQEGGSSVGSFSLRVEGGSSVGNK